MIRVFFRLITNAHSRAYVQVGSSYFDMPQVPARGDFVSVDGNPYHATHVAWVVSNTTSMTYAYIELARAGDPT